MDIEEEYFEWMYQLVGGKNYRSLLKYLDYEIFRPVIIEMDENRIADGVGLRYRYAEEAKIPETVVEKIFDDTNCSILELMIGLSIRMEDDIMGDPDYGNRTIIWFWEMIKSLGLYEMTDKDYDQEHAQHVIHKFLNREYESNGKGGLFTVKNTALDMRKTEIWQQMCLYCDNLL